MPTGGELLVAALRALDVEVAFGLPGVHNLAAWKAFPDSGVRHTSGSATGNRRPVTRDGTTRTKMPLRPACHGNSGKYARLLAKTRPSGSILGYT